MFSRSRFLAAAVTCLGCAALVPLVLPIHAAAQTSPVVTNVIPEGGEYAAQGKIQALDPGALTLTLVSEKTGPVPMTVAPGVDLGTVSVGDVADVHYTRSVTFVVAGPTTPVSNVATTGTVGQIAQTPGGLGAGAVTIVGRVVKLNAPSSFDVVNADGGGIYTVQVTHPGRQEAVKLLKVGDSITVSVSPLIVTSIAKCGVFGMGLLGC